MQSAAQSEYLPLTAIHRYASSLSAILVSSNSAYCVAQTSCHPNVLSMSPRCSVGIRTHTRTDGRTFDTGFIRSTLVEEST